MISGGIELIDFLIFPNINVIWRRTLNNVINDSKVEIHLSKTLNYFYFEWALNLRFLSTFFRVVLRVRLVGNNRETPFVHCVKYCNFT